MIPFLSARKSSSRFWCRTRCGGCANNRRIRRPFSRTCPKGGKRIRQGEFPANILDQFQGMLDYFGESPYIVRSSSILEDARGNAFSGKYESVFVANRGSREERLQALLDAVRTIYASVLDEEALTLSQTPRVAG
jgi:hypothetical protein